MVWCTIRRRCGGGATTRFRLPQQVSTRGHMRCRMLTGGTVRHEHNRAVRRLLNYYHNMYNIVIRIMAARVWYVHLLNMFVYMYFSCVSVLFSAFTVLIRGCFIHSHMEGIIWMADDTDPVKDVQLAVVTMVTYNKVRLLIYWYVNYTWQMGRAPCNKQAEYAMPNMLIVCQSNNRPSSTLLVGVP
jgi:hypothetical protein